MSISQAAVAVLAAGTKNVHWHHNDSVVKPPTDTMDSGKSTTLVHTPLGVTHPN